jgi:Protein of unknown function (DUF1541)
MIKKIIIFSFFVATTVVISACSINSDTHSNAMNNHQDMNMDHSNQHMDHAHAGQLPSGMKNASNPKYALGESVTIKDGHMPGMKDAQATIVGAYDTTVYTVTYAPTTGGEKVTHHKWIVQEEILNAVQTPYNTGDEVTLAAEHMPGMNGAKATIDSAQNMTVYVVDFTPTTGGDPIKNHMWVTEDELASK